MVAALAVILALAPARVDRLWVELDVGVPGRAATAVAISPVDDRVILVGADGVVFRTDDMGVEFDVVFKPGGGRQLSVQEQIAAEDQAEEASEDTTTDGDPGAFQVDLSNDELDDALNQMEEDIQEQLEADRTAGDALPEGDADVGTEQENVPPPRQLPGIRRILFVDGNTVFVATHKGLYRSTDAGIHFERVELPAGGGLQDVRDVAVAPQVQTFIVAATAGGTVQSRDGGITWLPAPGPAGGTPGLCAAVGPGANPVIAVGTPYGLARSLDGGRTYSAVQLPGEGPDRLVRSVTIDAQKDRLYAVTRTMLFSGEPSSRALVPTGAAWRQGLYTVYARAGRNEHVWAGGRSGVWLSKDGGRTASELGEEAMVRDVLDVAVGGADPDLVVAGTALGAVLFARIEQVPRGPSAAHMLRLLIAQEPTAAEVAEWAVQHHRVDPAVANGMRLRARVSNLLPVLDLRAQASLWNAYGCMRRQAPASGEAGFNLFQAELQNACKDGTSGAVVRSSASRFSGVALATGTWNLPQLINRSADVDIQREHRRLLTDRERVWARVTKVYQQRRRLQADMLARAGRNLAAVTRRRLKLEQLTALLDAQTGGRFTNEAWRRGAPGDGISARAMPGNEKGE